MVSVFDLIQHGLVVGNIQGELPGLPFSYTALHELVHPWGKMGFQSGLRLGIHHAGEVRQGQEPLAGCQGELELAASRGSSQLPTGEVSYLDQFL